MPTILSASRRRAAHHGHQMGFVMTVREVGRSAVSVAGTCECGADLIVPVQELLMTPEEEASVSWMIEATAARHRRKRQRVPRPVIIGHGAHRGHGCSVQRTQVGRGGLRAIVDCRCGTKRLDVPWAELQFLTKV